MRLLDASTAAERTALAWQRTGIALAATGALLAHVRSGSPSVAAGIVVLVAGLLTAAVIAPLRYRVALRQVGAGRSPVTPRVVAALAAAVVAATLTGAVLILTG